MRVIEEPLTANFHDGRITMAVYLLVTLDTKGAEAGFVRECLRASGLEVVVVDTGCVGNPAFTGDVTREDVFRAAGSSLDEVRRRSDRGHAVTLAARGAEAIVTKAYKQNRLTAVMGLGGSAGTTIGTTAMRSLPIGVPKLMVSTLASGQVRHYVGDKDILMLNSIVDIAGLNRISRRVLRNAAAAVIGLVQGSAVEEDSDKPMIAATMFGVTTPCVQHAKKILEEAGYEVLVFHATGNGGQAMESLIRDGMFAGVLDITTTELADELVGGVLSAGPRRLTAAGEAGIPQVVSVGALDMVNFAAPETVPERFRNRQFHRHNPTVTLMRTTPDENTRLGAEIGNKLSSARGRAVIMLPLQGISTLDHAGQPFDDPEAREALYASIRNSRGSTEVVELDHHINDQEFAAACARKLIFLLTDN